jgi:hypothetical protein
MGYVVDFGVIATRREQENYTSAQFCCVLRWPLELGACGDFLHYIWVSFAPKLIVFFEIVMILKRLLLRAKQRLRQSATAQLKRNTTTSRDESSRRI